MSLLEDAVKFLGKRVTSFKKGSEGTIAIAVEWKDPKLAADIANYYVAALAEFMKDKSINQRSRSLITPFPRGKNPGR